MQKAPLSWINVPNVTCLPVGLPVCPHISSTRFSPRVANCNSASLTKCAPVKLNLPCPGVSAWIPLPVPCYWNPHSQCDFLSQTIAQPDTCKMHERSLIPLFKAFIRATKGVHLPNNTHILPSPSAVEGRN